MSTQPSLMYSMLSVPSGWRTYRNTAPGTLVATSRKSASRSAIARMLVASGIDTVPRHEVAPAESSVVNVTSKSISDPRRDRSRKGTWSKLHAPSRQDWNVWRNAA